MDVLHNPIIEIKQGKLMGTTSADLNGKKFYAFRGIPYAKPPLGNLRFKAPLPPSPWKGIFDATQEGSACYSIDLFKKQIIGSEDCLNLNIYTPTLSTPKNNLLPVMVWIHGGGFVCGSNSSNFYGPEFLMMGNIILVTINYRLGLLGFLSLEDPKAGVPGNAGLKDMVMALKWIKENIQQFSGDPNNVTIFGESAGGAAVHFLMLSSMAQGLFHKAISQSGCALNPWTRGKKADNEIYKLFGCEGKKDIEFLEYLQSIPVETILQNQAKIEYFIDPNKIGYFGLVIEQIEEEQNEEPFMAEEPLDIILSKKFNSVPFIIGYTNMEGLVVNTYSTKRVINMITNFETNLPHFLGYKVGSEKSKFLGQQIKELYFGDEEPSQRNRDRFYEMVTDHSFLYGIYTTVRLHSANLNCPVYFYRMSLTTSLKFLQATMKVDKNKGAAHGDDVAYLFKTIFTPPILRNSIEYNFINSFVKMWTNFAYHGTPNSIDSPVTWEPANKNFGYFSIDKELTFHPTFEQRSLKFWNKLYAESPSGKRFSNFYCKI